MSKNIGFIGCGNMTKAIIKGFMNKKKINSKNFFIYDINFKKIKYLINKYKVINAKNLKNLLKNTKIIILSIKPNSIFKLIKKIKQYINRKKIIISIAAGIKIKDIEKRINKEKTKIVRIIPNTSVMINKGLISISFNKNIKKKEKKELINLFKILGKVLILKENLFSIITAISSSLPAYFYIFIESIADAAVLKGMEKKLAFKLSSQAIKGACETIIKTKKHPSLLRDKICSIKGTTIEGIKFLEKNRFRFTIIETIIKCIEKSKNILK